MTCEIPWPGSRWAVGMGSSILLHQPPVRQCPFTQKVGETTLSSLVEAIPVQSFQPGEEVEEVWARGDFCVLFIGMISRVS